RYGVQRRAQRVRCNDGLGRADSRTKCNTEWAGRGRAVILGRNSFRQEGVATMAYHQLTREERYLTAWGLRLKVTLREIAEVLGRSPSTVSREIRRNATTHDGAYRSEKADSYAVARRRRSRRGSQYSEEVFAEVDAAIRERWSPEQIVGRF